MSLINKHKSPVLLLATLPGIFNILLTLTRIILAVSLWTPKIESKLLNILTAYFLSEQRDLCGLSKFRWVSKKTQRRFLQRIQQGYAH